MRSSFFEFNVATTALFSARANLQVTSHNVANAETVGFSRQYAEQRATVPISTFNGRGMVGTGSEVYGVGQMRDFYLDKKYWTGRSVLGEYSAKYAQLNVTQSIFNPLTNTGINDAFTDFFNKLQSLSENAGDSTYRTNAIQAGESITSYISLISQNLRKQQKDINTEISATVDIINSLGEQIRSLNRQISTYEMDGSKANDLRDARALLVDELSLYVNVEVRETENNAEYAAGMYPEPEDRGRSDKRFKISINGYEFINHFDIKPLEVRERASGEKNNAMDAEGLYDIYFKGGIKFDMYHPGLQGELKGLIDMRDGNNGTTTARIIDPITGQTKVDSLGKPSNTNYKGIPHYMNKLNELIRTFAKAINQGKDKDGNPIPGVIGHVDGWDASEPPKQGNLFFTCKMNGNYVLTEADVIAAGGWNKFYESLTVDNFAINPEMAANPSLLASASTNIGGISDNEVIKSFSKIKNNISLFREGKLEDFITGMIGELGIDGKQAEKFASNYMDVTTMTDNQRRSVSGVDINEEMVNMMKYQQLYQAAARLISIIDSIYDTTVNRLGAW